MKGVANRISLIRENCFRETLQITRSAKIVCLENLALYGNSVIFVSPTPAVVSELSEVVGVVVEKQAIMGGEGFTVSITFHEQCSMSHTHAHTHTHTHTHTL